MVSARGIAALLVVLVASTIAAVQAQTVSSSRGRAFGTCAAWKQELTQSEGAEGTQRFLQGYRIGTSHGIALGLLTDPMATSAALANEKWDSSDSLEPYYTTGLATVLRRPAVLIEAFDAKCSDYRNEPVKLYRVALIAIFELGGIPEDRVEPLLRLFRQEGSENMWPAIRAAVAGRK